MKKYLLVLGWIIWINSGPSWQRLGSFESESECSTEMTTRMEKMAGTRVEGSVVSDHTIKFRDASGNFRLLNFSCISDDIDPRYQ